MISLSFLPYLFPLHLPPPGRPHSPPTINPYILHNKKERLALFLFSLLVGGMAPTKMCACGPIRPTSCPLLLETQDDPPLPFDARTKILGQRSLPRLALHLVVVPDLKHPDAGRVARHLRGTHATGASCRSLSHHLLALQRLRSSLPRKDINFQKISTSEYLLGAAERVASRRMQECW